jgi:hypothetical protein
MKDAFFTDSLACCSSEVLAKRGLAGLFLASGTSKLAAISGMIVKIGSAATARKASLRLPAKCDSSSPSPKASKSPRLTSKDHPKAISQRRPSPPCPRMLGHSFVINAAKMAANPHMRNPVDGMTNKRPQILSFDT